MRPSSAAHDPWTLVTPLIARLHVLGAVEFLYVTGWMLAVALVPAAVALAPSLKPIRVRFFLAYILTWVIIGNLLALAFLSAGPVYFGHVTGDTARFQPLIDLLAANSGSIWSAYDIQRALWTVYAHGMVSFGTGISAFPSEHVAMAALWAITGFQVNRRLGIAGLVFLAFVEAASVALGWHYAVDGLVSMVLVVLIWLAVGWTLRRFAPAETRAGAAMVSRDHSLPLHRTGEAAGLSALAPVLVPLAVGGVLYLVLLISGDRLLNDPDSYWHIVVGRWIVAHRAFPTHDPFSFTFAGAPWIAKEWLSQILYAGAHAARRLVGHGDARRRFGRARLCPADALPAA